MTTQSAVRWCFTFTQSRLPGTVTTLAGQLGLPLGTDPSQSPRFYAQVAHSRELLTWEGTVDLASAVRPGRTGHRTWVVELAITSGADSTVVPLSGPADGVPAQQPDASLPLHHAG